MFVLSASSLFYTGRAGDAWLSPDAGEAFAYASREEAGRRAGVFNRATALHGFVFVVEERAQ